MYIYLTCYSSSCAGMNKFNKTFCHNCIYINRIQNKHKIHTGIHVEEVQNSKVYIPEAGKETDGGPAGLLPGGAVGGFLKGGGGGCPTEGGSDDILA